MQRGRAPNHESHLFHFTWSWPLRYHLLCYFPPTLLSAILPPRCYPSRPDWRWSRPTVYRSLVPRSESDDGVQAAGRLTLVSSADHTSTDSLASCQRVLSAISISTLQPPHPPRLPNSSLTALTCISSFTAASLTLHLSDFPIFARSLELQRFTLSHFHISLICFCFLTTASDNGPGVSLSHYLSVLFRYPEYPIMYQTLPTYFRSVDFLRSAHSALSAYWNLPTLEPKTRASKQGPENAPRATVSLSTVGVGSELALPCLVLSGTHASLSSDLPFLGL